MEGGRWGGGGRWNTNEVTRGGREGGGGEAMALEHKCGGGGVGVMTMGEPER